MKSTKSLKTLNKRVISTLTALAVFVTAVVGSTPFPQKQQTEVTKLTVNGAEQNDNFVEISQSTDEITLTSTSANTAGTPDTDWYTTAEPTQTEFTISTADELAGLAELVNGGNNFSGKTITLANDISLSAYSDGAGWTPIGSTDYWFCGNFDGGGYVITGLYIDHDGYTGLFGCITSGSVANLGIIGADINGGRYTGGVAGYIAGSNITNCYVTGTVSGTIDVGGVAGGIAVSDSVTNCYTTATVSGNLRVGGVVGNSDGSISNCYATGTVSCTENDIILGSGDYAGGVAGNVGNGKVENCAALNISVTGTGANVGRVVGYSLPTVTLSNNAAFDGIINNAGNTTWSNIGATALDGANITALEIMNDGTIGGLFTAPNWITQNGKLPVLANFETGEQSGEIPRHIKSLHEIFINGEEVLPLTVANINSEIETALDELDEVTVTGKFTYADEELDLTVPAGKKSYMGRGIHRRYQHGRQLHHD